MLLKSITCLPCVASQPDVIDIGDSRIVHLPFDEWLVLEGQSRSAPYNKLERRYNQNPPVFWEKTIDVDSSLVLDRKPENVRFLREYIERELEALVKALHWYTGIAPIHPTRSITYFDPRSKENFAAYPELDAVITSYGVPKCYGESEREYATMNENPTIFLKPTDAASLSAMFSFSLQTQDVWMNEQYDLASQSLNLTSTPGLDWLSQIILLVGAYEALFLPEGNVGQLQKDFEKRLSSMVAGQFEEVIQYSSWLKLAYQLRSDLVHGRPLTKLLKKLQLPPNEYVKVFGRIGVIALCKLIRYRYEHPEGSEGTDSLWAALDSADDPKGFIVLQDLIANTSAAPVSHQWQMEERSC